MLTGYQIKDQEALYYLTLQIVDWIDVFSRKVYRDNVPGSIRYFQHNKGLQVSGYVIMSKLVHLMCNSPGGKLSDNIRDLKKITNRKIIETIETGNELLLIENMESYAVGDRNRIRRCHILRLARG